MSGVIFLDMDGVVNSRRFLAQFKEYPTLPIDPAAVALLNEVVDRTNASFVLSSTWREGGMWCAGVSPLWTVQQHLEQHGFRGQLVGATAPPWRMGPHPLIWSKRGDEIQKYIEEHGVKNYVIVDDSNDMLESQQSRFVRTDFETGLQRYHVECIVDLLGRGNRDRAHSRGVEAAE